MARLLRSYGVSRLRPPIAVSAAVTFRPLDITLSVTLTRSRSTPPERTIRSDLQPPTTVGPSTVFRPTSINLAATRTSRLARAPHPDLKPPAVVASAVTFGPIKIRLVRTPRQPAAPHSELRPPATVADPIVFRPVDITLAAILSRLNTALPKRAVKSRLKPPAVVGASTVFRPTMVMLARRTWADMVRRAAHSKYNPPATLAPPPQPPTAEQLRFRTWLTRIRPPRFMSRVRPPAVVAPASVYAPVTVELTRTPRARFHVRSFLTLVQFFPVIPPPTLEQLKTRIFLTRRGPVRLTKSKIKPPTVTGPPLVFAPIRIELAPSSRLARATHPKLKLPAVVAYPVTAEQRYLNLYLAPHPKQGRRSTWRLQPPSTIIALVAPPYLEGWRRTDMQAGDPASGSSLEGLDLVAAVDTGRGETGVEAGVGVTGGLE